MNRRAKITSFLSHTRWAKNSHVSTSFNHGEGTVTEKTIGLYPALVVPDHCEPKWLTYMNLSGFLASCGADGDEQLPGMRVGIPRK